LTAYPRLAVHYAEVGERGKAKAYINESLEALSHVGPSIAELRRLLSPYYSPLEFEQWVAELPLYVYFNAALAYMALGDVQSGLEMVERAWNLVSTYMSNERVVARALEAYLVALAYQRDEEFDKVVEEYSEFVSRISDTTYIVLKKLGANTQKLNEIMMRRFNKLDTLFKLFFALMAIAFVAIAKGATSTAHSSQSESDPSALVRSHYAALLDELLYV